MSIRPPYATALSAIFMLGSATVACTGPQVTEAPADLVLFNGSVFPADGTGDFHEALAIRGATIAAVGTNEEIDRLRGPQTEVIDAAGRAIVPGFNDNHVHLMAGGRSLELADLQRAGTLEEVQRRIRAFAEAQPERPWVQGSGWSYNAFPDRLPTRQQLDAVVPDRPAVMVAFDYHTSWVNSRALELAGIDRNTPDPVGGEIVRDPFGEPTGVLKEGPAMSLINRVLAPRANEDDQRSLQAAIAEAHRFGVTSITEASGSRQGLALLEEARRTGQLALRVHYALRVNPGFSEEDLEAFDAVWRQQPDTPALRTGIAKLMLDGVASTYTAVMLEPYADRPTTGSPFFSKEEFERIVEMLDRRGWQMMIHTLGDGAVRMALDALEQAAALNPEPERGRRHRLEHVSYVDPTDTKRFGELGVIFARQGGGGFTPPDPAPPSGAGSSNVGLQRWAERGGLVKTVFDSGGIVTLGSDWPIAPFNPMGRVTNVVRQPPRPGGADQRLPMTAAIEAYTRWSAYASFQESRVGTLQPGMLADVVMLATDVFSRPPTTPEDVAVALTVFDGQIVYRGPSAP